MYSLKSIVLLANLAIVVARFSNYRFKLDIGNPNELCPGIDFKCKDGSAHFLCSQLSRRHAKCICHNAVDLSDGNIKTFLEATNGIRNKVAGDLEIANMNLVYWSHELMEAANVFLRLCNRTIDECLAVGEKNIKVSQNTAFYEGELGARWPGRMVRHWYYELMNHTIDKFDDFVKLYNQKIITNLTKLVNPLVEFVGCGAARFARGYFIACYYNPPLEEDGVPKNFRLGKPAGKCNDGRKMVSKTFTNLCGIDFDWIAQRGSRGIASNIFLISVGFLFACLF